ncbi:peptidylprolyl isomerase [Candidatus Nitrospira neomarina]|uniref:Peptidylprolyl isomerase n=1 Tax=Candidatus Nitrospira neomarina TaxID=3020899 RepID=A0AA96K4Q3_9BACT|nr:peptidylprolyl isomerase [Candidatus Nitrospira neomarina]WNM63584.1 peptidylprolyl isomerase [Candidatus Nitrospira neomarina]
MELRQSFTKNFRVSLNQGVCPPEQVTAVFGTTFAETLLLLTPGFWEGPIESGLGWNIVWVESITPGHPPAFEEIEPDIKTQWREKQRIKSIRRTFEAIIPLRGGPASRACDQ